MVTAIFSIFFLADFGTFKPYNVGIAPDIAKLKNGLKLHRYGILVQDIVDLGAVAAGNDALLQLLGSRKIAKIAHFAQAIFGPLHRSFATATSCVLVSN